LSVIDTSGLLCPLPILTVKKRLKAISPDAVITVITTDSSSAADFPVFFEQVGWEMMESFEEGGSFSFVVKKKP
jgi:tRNA 2-thiouridine synthesizing protein A